MKLFNTLSRKKEVFEPLNRKSVSLYSCGPTVYNYAHIGNLRTYIFVDTLKKALRYDGYKVKHVMNITDVGHLTSDADIGEDKMLLTALREKRSVWDIAAYYTDVFKKNISDLNITPPDIWCKATDHIKEQILLIKKLEKRGYTYRIKDGIYFDTAQFKDYSKLARLKLTDQKAGARVQENKEKRHPWDFALWKFSSLEELGPQREMEWESPWGVGFPGWHIECSAMSTKYLGQPFDIHTGGIDHIPIHHTNEIAQSEAANGKQMARWWMHAEFLVIDKARMGKSAGNFITLQHLIDRGFDPLDYRFFCFSAHYRAQLTFSWDALSAAREGRHHLKSQITKMRNTAGRGIVSEDIRAITQKHEQKFSLAIQDDLNIPKALSVVFSLLRAVMSNKDRTSGDFNFAYKQILAWDSIICLGLAEQMDTTAEIPSNIILLVKQREDARKEKDWERADALRKEIALAGFSIEDTAHGPTVVQSRR